MAGGRGAGEIPGEEGGTFLALPAGKRKAEVSLHKLNKKEIRREETTNTTKEGDRGLWREGGKRSMTLYPFTEKRKS